MGQGFPALELASLEVNLCDLTLLSTSLPTLARNSAVGKTVAAMACDERKM